jgi:hypothetical protein
MQKRGIAISFDLLLQLDEGVVALDRLFVELEGFLMDLFSPSFVGCFMVFLSQFFYPLIDPLIPFADFPFTDSHNTASGFFVGSEAEGDGDGRDDLALVLLVVDPEAMSGNQDKNAADEKSRSFFLTTRNGLEQQASNEAVIVGL